MSGSSFLDAVHPGADSAPLVGVRAGCTHQLEEPRDGRRRIEPVIEPVGVDDRRLPIAASRGAVAVVMIVKDSKDSPSLLQRSDRAANDSGDPSASARKKGCLPRPVRCHSNHPLAGTKHLRERNASLNDGLV